MLVSKSALLRPDLAAGRARHRRDRRLVAALPRWRRASARGADAGTAMVPGEQRRARTSGRLRARAGARRSHQSAHAWKRGIATRVAGPAEAASVSSNARRFRRLPEQPQPVAQSGRPGVRGARSRSAVDTWVEKARDSARGHRRAGHWRRSAAGRGRAAAGRCRDRRRGRRARRRATASSCGTPRVARRSRRAPAAPAHRAADQPVEAERPAAAPGYRARARRWRRSGRRRCRAGPARRGWPAMRDASSARAASDFHQGLALGLAQARGDGLQSSTATRPSGRAAGCRHYRSPWKGGPSPHDQKGRANRPPTRARPRRRDRARTARRRRA